MSEAAFHSAFWRELLFPKKATPPRCVWFLGFIFQYSGPNFTESNQRFREFGTCGWRFSTVEGSSLGKVFSDRTVERPPGRHIASVTDKLVRRGALVTRG